MDRYSTMDNIDGKQARRTGTSSGLGELFEYVFPFQKLSQLHQLTSLSHGIDSLNCTLGSLLETSAMGLGPTKIGAVAALIPTLPMFFSTWETYHSHTLFLGWFNGPTEGLIIACCLMLASGYFGAAIYHTPLRDLFGLTYFLGSYTIADLLPWILLGSFAAAHLPSCVQNVVEARRKNNLPISSVFLEWTPMLIYSVSTCIWLGSPSSVVLKDNHLLLWCLTQSFVFGRMTTKIILAHLTRRPFPMWTVLIAPLVGGAVLFGIMPVWFGVQFGESAETFYLWCYFVFAMVVYARWAFVVISAICEFLDISCLTIPEEKQRANREAAERGKLS